MQLQAMILSGLIISICFQAIFGSDYNAPATTGTLAGRIGGKRTIVLLDNMMVKHTHSEFFEYMKLRGHQLSFHLSTAQDTELFKQGESMYDNLVIFAPKAKFENEGLSINSVFEFVDNGGNVLVAGGSDMSKSLRQIGALSGIIFDQSGSAVLDHFNYSADLNVPSSMYTVIETNSAVDNQYLLGEAAQLTDSVLYSGIAHKISEDNILVSPVLRAEDTAYSHSYKKRTHAIHTIGSDNILVSAIQARNNARMIISGSLDMFSNRFFQSAGSGNRIFCNELSKWVFAERGVLRVSNVMHKRKDGSSAELLLKQKIRSDQPASLFPEPEIAKNSQVYRIMDEITYSLKIEQYDADKGGWIPFSASDVQVEFVMLDPYERITLDNDPYKGIFSTTFTAPDTYGIFKFRIMYRRIGLTVLLVSTQVSIRPFKHNEYERFIPSAYPYYTGVFSIMIGFFIFAYFFMNIEEAETRKLVNK